MHRENNRLMPKSQISKSKPGVLSADQGHMMINSYLLPDLCSVTVRFLQ